MERNKHVPPFTPQYAMFSMVVDGRNWGGLGGRHGVMAVGLVFLTDDWKIVAIVIQRKNN